MTRVILVAIAALTGAFFGLQPVQAYEAPWCAVIELGRGSIYWDCQYRSFEECYRNGNVLETTVASAIRALTMSPTLQDTRAQRNAALARSSSATDISINVRFWPKAGIPSCTPCPLSGGSGHDFFVSRYPK
jgi:hypothetical protein